MFWLVTNIRKDVQKAKKIPLFVLIALLFAPNPLFLVGERGDIYSQFMITPPPIVWTLLRIIENFAPPSYEVRRILFDNV